FVLDMGEPVRIYDLATNLIKLSGFEPGRDIKIKITGLRPGEKLYEELLMAEEGLESTPNELIYVGRPNGFDQVNLRSELQRLKEKLSLEDLENDEVKEMILKLVPTYAPDLDKMNSKIS
ncbi:MAG: polysaccharide biosynthesis protein, partial [Clostridium sp.]|nr:polysaccharide biosynthesis protein [Clostridium sp.]